MRQSEHLQVGEARGLTCKRDTSTESEGSVGVNAGREKQCRQEEQHGQRPGT